MPSLPQTVRAQADGTNRVNALSSEKIVRIKRLKAPTAKSIAKKKQGKPAKGKTGERPRTKSGRFRKKRSDAGKPRK